MNTDRVALLRQMLKDIDIRLLRHLAGPHPLGDDVLKQVATLETVRGAIHRLLAAPDLDSGS